MRDFIKSHTLVLVISICLSAGLANLAIQKNSCFEINVDERVKIKAGCQIEL